MAHQKAYPCRQAYAPKHARDSLPRARRRLRCRRREDGQEEARHTDFPLRRRSCDEDGVQKGETVRGLVGECFKTYMPDTLKGL